MHRIVAAVLVALAAGCDSSEPEIIPAGLQGTWSQVTSDSAGETIEYRTENGYRFEVSQNGEVVQRGGFATVDFREISDAFEIRYAVYTDESLVDGRSSERVAFRGEDTLMLTAVETGSVAREYRRVD